jgi:hypothetical protein
MNHLLGGKNMKNTLLKRSGSKVLAISIAVIMCISLMPSSVRADSVTPLADASSTFDLSTGKYLDDSSPGTAADALDANNCWLDNDTGFYVTAGADVTVTGTSAVGSGTGVRRIVVSGDAHITIENTVIDCSDDSRAPIFVGSGADLTLTLVGDNTLTAGTYFAGVEVNNGSLTIDGIGSLTALGSDGHQSSQDIHGTPGIGSHYGGSSPSGEITIKSGTIEAIGGTYAAGIGGSDEGGCSVITIDGGNITATGGDSGAGIGNGKDGYGGDIIISGGDIVANGKNGGAGIGNGLNINEPDSVFDSIYIVDGRITANSDRGAGIGVGETLNAEHSSSVNNLLISGGIITPNSASAKDIDAGKDGNLNILGATIYSDDNIINAPIFSNVTSSRVGATSGMMLFNSNKVGNMYYQIGGSVKPSPKDIINSGRSVALKSGSNTVALSLPTSGAQTLYYVTKNTPEGFVGAVQSLTIPRYYYSNPTPAKPYNTTPAAPTQSKISLKKPSLRSVKVGKKKVTVKWRRSKDSVTGYQIAYKQKGKKKFKTIKVKGQKKVSRVIKKLKAGKRYQFKLRTYKKVSTKTYYSKYSKIKTSKKIKR